jgi:kynurenine formamidase
MMYVELLANLAKLPPRGAFFIFLPIKIAGGSAGPGRAIALVP